LYRVKSVSIIPIYFQRFGLFPQKHENRNKIEVENGNKLN